MGHSAMGTWRYVLWTGEDMDRFMQTHYPSFYRTFKSYKYLIQQIDAFLYHYGGISTSVSEPRPGVGKVHERVIELHERAHDGVGAKPFHETVYVRSRAPQSLLRTSRKTFTRESYQYIYVHIICFSCVYAISPVQSLFELFIEDPGKNLFGEMIRTYQKKRAGQTDITSFFNSSSNNKTLEVKNQSYYPPHPPLPKQKKKQTKRYPIVNNANWQCSSNYNVGGTSRTRFWKILVRWMFIRTICLVSYIDWKPLFQCENQGSNFYFLKYN